MPPEILDALESVVEIFCSAVRHRERAAYILCDNLVEMACKTRALQHNHRFDTSIGFHASVTAPGVILDAALIPRLTGYRNTRNNMQHVGAALTVDAQHCADAVMDAVQVINTLWPPTPVHLLRNRLAVSLRIVRLYSSYGDPVHREDFISNMLGYDWRNTENEQVRRDAVQIKPGQREYWSHALFRRIPDVQRLLDESGVPLI